MNPKSRIPTKAEEESMHRKVSLVLNMLGKDTDTAMTVLLYALTLRTLADGVVFENVIENFRSVHKHIEAQHNDYR
jgi:hypothetical protein